MFIFNTTRIPESTIRLIASIVKPKSTPEVESITLRNKKENHIKGNWGWYYPNDNKITLCVPRTIYEYISESPYTNQTRILLDINDFLALVIGHEYYHANQYCYEKHMWSDKEYLEIGAESYEPTALELWNKYKDESGWKEELKRVGKINYKDYR